MTSGHFGAILLVEGPSKATFRELKGVHTACVLAKRQGHCLQEPITRLRGTAKSEQQMCVRVTLNLMIMIGMAGYIEGICAR